MKFVDRRDAGRRLAERLGELRGEDPVVLALPRGGDVISVETPSSMVAIGQWYEAFRQTPDEAVVALLGGTGS